MHLTHNPADSPKEPSERGNRLTDTDLVQISRSLNGLRFGSVQITVQDGVIVQIDRTEKRRIRFRNARGS